VSDIGALPLAPKNPLSIRQLLRAVRNLDAGHGGKDPGALGEDAHEKDLTLAAATKFFTSSFRYRVK